MIKKSKDGIQWLEFEIFSNIPGLTHGCFLRHGGFSRGDYGSLNVGLRGGDDPAAVQRNMEKIQKLFPVAHLARSTQCHSDQITVVVDEMEIGECDAMITQKKGVALLIKTADCQAAIVYDPVHRAIANIHAGWRGNVQNIYGKTVQCMRNECGSKPEDLLVGISPSLGPEASEFIHYKEEFPEEFWPFQVKPNYFDLWAIGRKQFLDAGVLPHHIEIAGLCTYGNNHDFFSYRREKKSGRQATIIALN